MTRIDPWQQAKASKFAFQDAATKTRDRSMPSIPEKGDVSHERPSKSELPIPSGSRSTGNAMQRKLQKALEEVEKLQKTANHYETRLQSHIESHSAAPLPSPRSGSTADHRSSLQASQVANRLPSERSGASAVESGQRPAAAPAMGSERSADAMPGRPVRRPSI